MWANDTNYTVVKNGVVVLSGTGPAMRVENNRLVIRDGPKETPPLCLSRAEASRKLRHVVACSRGGGYVTLDAFEWLRDTGVSFSQLDGRGGVVIASGPRGPDRPALRRAQILICSGIVPQAAVAIAREILSVKVRGQAHVARLLGAEDTAAAIDRLAGEFATAESGVHLLATEATAAAAYWKLWGSLPVRFARQSPQRLDARGRWRAGRSERWLTFGPRTSLLTGKPWRASTPGNALLNYLFGVLASEVTLALHAAGLDPGIGIFHVDKDGAASLAHDAMEAVRPYVECWLAAYLASTAFANRDFVETTDGEVRLTHPLTSHFAMTAALWRPACERVAGWLARAFTDAGRIEVSGLPAAGMPDSEGRALVAARLPARQHAIPRLDWPLPEFPPAPAHGRRLISLRAGLTDDPTPRGCFECGKALSGRQRRFCSDACGIAYHSSTSLRAIVAASATRRADPVQAAAENAARGAKAARHAANRAAWRIRPGWSKAGDEVLRRLYVTEILPRLSAVKLAAIMAATGLTKTSAIAIRSGRHVPEPYHFAVLARLAGIEPLPASTGAGSSLS